MANCKFCGEPVKVTPVFHPECWEHEAQEIAETFCDTYCKYPTMYGDDGAFSQIHNEIVHTNYLVVDDIGSVGSVGNDGLKGDGVMREKLIDLLTKLLSTPINIYVDEVREIGVATVIADYLIAHGVTVQKKGKWAVKRDDKISKDVCCTNCLQIFYFVKKGALNIDMMPYCPNCGAKMDGDQK